MGKSADIEFEIGSQIGVIEGHSVDIRVSIQLWEPAAHDGCFDACVRQSYPNLSEGECLEFHNIGSAGQRFGDSSSK